MRPKANGQAKIIFRRMQRPFHTFSLTLLSLLHPLSFVLLSRLSSPPPLTSTSILFYTLVVSLSLSSLFSTITGRILHVKLPTSVAWIFLCIYQVCITIGIETSIGNGFKPLKSTGCTDRETWLKRFLLFVGIFDQTVLWKRKLVKPVVDDTIYGEERKEQAVDRLVIGVSFCVLWLWLLQGELRPLVLATRKGGLRKAEGWGGVVLWSVTSATLMTGFVRTVELLVWLLSATLQFMHRREEEEGGFSRV